MDWKKQLELFEHDQDWKSAIDLVKGMAETEQGDVEVYIRAIYLLHHVLVETQYSKSGKDEAEKLLKYHFNYANHKFSDNSEYLFFVSKLLYIAEWLFGIDDNLKPLEDRIAFKMQKKAHEIEPDNLLFEWAYRFSLRDAFAGRLAQQIINEHSKLDWLRSKGFPGEYVLSSLKRNKAKYEESDPPI
jgi:hypothetical protein